MAIQNEPAYQHCDSLLKPFLIPTYAIQKYTRTASLIKKKGFVGASETGRKAPCCIRCQTLPPLFNPCLPLQNILSNYSSHNEVDKDQIRIL